MARRVKLLCAIFVFQSRPNGCRTTASKSRRVVNGNGTSRGCISAIGFSASRIMTFFISSSLRGFCGSFLRNLQRKKRIYMRFRYAKWQFLRAKMIKTHFSFRLSCASSSMPGPVQSPQPKRRRSTYFGAFSASFLLFRAQTRRQHRQR